MNKVKVTKKDMRDNVLILGVGYCSMQYLLKYHSPIAYSVGTYGWACDYYLIRHNNRDLIISMGYSPISSKRFKTDYDTINSYEKKAEKIANNYNISYDDRKKQVTKLLNELLDKLKKE